MTPRKICFFTGTRAEYGIMSELMRMVDRDPSLELQIVATNMHLSPEFGLTYREIEADGFRISRKVEMLLSSDTPVGTAKSMGLGIIGYADAISELNPDLIVILGDRYEMLGVAQTALMFQKPVAHLYGGEITEGAYDDAIRHAITKLSHLHFTSTEEYRDNVIQMGEDPAHVFNVGALGIDNLLRTPLMTLPELEESIGHTLGDDFVIVTFHPVTTQPGEAGRQVESLLQSLSRLPENYRILFTLPNSDTDGRIVAARILEYESTHPERVKVVPSLGKRRYYSAVKLAKAVVGNSSSGLIEAPSLGTPTLNIGDRQKGRAQGPTVVNCGITSSEITEGLSKALSPEMAAAALLRTNPYAGEATLDRIFEAIARYPLQGITAKTFHRLPSPDYTNSALI